MHINTHKHKHEAFEDDAMTHAMHNNDTTLMFMTVIKCHSGLEFGLGLGLHLTHAYRKLVKVNQNKSTLIEYTCHDRLISHYVDTFK